MARLKPAPLLPVFPRGGVDLIGVLRRDRVLSCLAGFTPSTAISVYLSRAVRLGGNLATAEAAYGAGGACGD